MLPPIWFIELYRIEHNRRARNSTNPNEGLSLNILKNTLNDLGLDNEELINVTTAAVSIPMRLINSGEFYHF